MGLGIRKLRSVRGTDSRFEDREREPGRLVMTVDVGVGDVTVERQCVAGGDLVALAVDLNGQSAVLDVE